MQNLLAFDFWFNYDFVPLLDLFRNLFVGSVILFIVIAAVFSFLARRKNLWTALNLNLYYFGLTNAIVGLVLLFFYFEQVPFFSARAWLLLWAIEIILWVVSMILQACKIPVARRALEEKKKFDKYLPK